MSIIYSIITYTLQDQGIKLYMYKSCMTVYIQLVSLYSTKTRKYPY